LSPKFSPPASGSPRQIHGHEDPRSQPPSAPSLPGPESPYNPPRSKGYKKSTGWLQHRSQEPPQEQTIGSEFFSSFCSSSSPLNHRVPLWAYHNKFCEKKQGAAALIKIENIYTFYCSV